RDFHVTGVQTCALPISLLLALDDELRPAVVMAEAPHGTAPSLEGKDVANPMAMILAAAALLERADGGDEPARAIRASVMETLARSEERRGGEEGGDRRW